MRSIPCLLLLLASTASYASTIRYGIAIGNNAPPAGQPDLPTLRYADDDAVRYYQLFEKLGTAYLLTSFDVESQRRYPELASRAEPPTLANLKRVIAEVAARMHADRARGVDSVFYLAFSGHGVIDENGAYLALADQGLTQSILYDQILAPLPAAYSHLFIDACHAGAVVGVRGQSQELDARTVPVDAQDLAKLIQTSTLARFPTVGAIISTTAGEQAHEWSRLESGVFTHELISALLGAADVNGDGNIEYTEVQAFIASANHRVRDPRAVPTVVAHPPASNRSVVLTSLDTLRGVTPLRGNLSALGRFHVELENGQRYLEAHLNEDLNSTLALPRDGLAYLVAGNREATLRLDGAPVSVDRLRFIAPHTALRGSIDAAYRNGLFAAPFGASYYHGYVDSLGVAGVETAVARNAREGIGYTPRRKGGIALLAAAGALAVTCIVTGALASVAKHDFTSTNFQRPAYDANQRYGGFLWTTGATGAASIAFGIAGGVLTWK